jgi:hypothetical protein
MLWFQHHRLSVLLFVQFEKGALLLRPRGCRCPVWRLRSAP